MIFKEPQMQAQYEARPAILKQICDDFCALSQDYGIEPVVTRVTDPVPGESGVHPQGRAVDFRDQHEGGFLYTDEQKAAILAELNRKYPRNDGRETVISHSFQGMPFHFHLQIPPVDGILTVIADNPEVPSGSEVKPDQ